MKASLAALLVLAGCSPSGPPSPFCTLGAAPLYPAPRFATQAHDGMRVRTVCIEGADFDPTDMLAEVGLVVGAPCDWTLSFGAAPSVPDAAASIWTAAGSNPERYLVVTDDHGHTTLAGHSQYALRMALSTSTPIDANTRCVGPATIVDYPDFPIRGIVESFDGSIYAPEERLATIRMSATLRMNEWVYGPKLDHYTHEQWADPYPPAEGQVIADAAREAESRGIRFYWAVSPGFNFWEMNPPGTSIQYSSDADLASLEAKFENLRSLGVNRFALFLDDLDQDLVWPEDQAAFSSLVEAHSLLIGRVNDYLASGDLIVVLARYTNFHSDWRDYISALAPTLDPSIQVFWTGAEIYSESIAASDLSEVDSLLGRKVLVWDNAPLQIDALRNRAADLPTTASGYLENPVLSEAHNPIGVFWSVFGPIGDYAWNPAAYDPDASLATWHSIHP